MALAISVVDRDVQGSTRVVYADVTFDNSYPTTGEPLTPDNVGLRQIVFVGDEVAKNAAGTSAVPVRFDYVNNKLQAYRYDGASAGKAFLEEVANAVDLSTFTVRLRIEGV